MKKVLVGYLIDGKRSGIDKYLLSVLDMVSPQNAQFDFLTTKKSAELEEMLKKKKSRLYEVSSLKHPLKQYHEIKELIQRNSYDIVYMNISEAFNSMGVKAAKDCGVKKIMVHSHSSGVDSANPLKRNIRKVIHYMFRQILYRWATDYEACSKKAGLWLFPEHVVNSSEFQLIQNAVNAERFTYNEETRAEVREELGLDNYFVVGFVGNFCYQKNIPFLIEIMRELRAIKSNALLLAIGSGPDMAEAKQLIEKYDLKEQVVFLGNRNDVPRLMQGMDFFLLPSRFEGLPIVGIEAQVAGMRIVLSDTISREVRLSENCIFVSIKSPAKEWAKKIKENSVYRRISSKELKTTYCFDIKQQKKLLNSLFE